MKALYDLVIVGGGAAGLTAALYAQRSALNFIVLDPSSPEGSSIALTDTVDNYAGFAETSGFELIGHFHSHAKSLGTVFVRDSLSGIKKSRVGFTVQCPKDEIRTKSVILCMGASHKPLGVSGEYELEGRGVSYCAVCDGYFFKDKTVVVVGGGNSAATEALYLSNICKRVYLIHRGRKLRADKILANKIARTRNIKTLYGERVKKINGTASVDSVTLVSSKVIKAQGVFASVGIQPRTERVRSVVRTDENGFIVAGEDCRTSTAGIFAAGDIRTKNLRQIVTACCDGANSVYGVNKFLELYR